MALPAFDWLRRQLSGVDQVSGGWEAKMRHPVAAGAGFAISSILVLAWLLALVPLCFWAAGRWVLGRARSTGGAE